MPAKAVGFTDPLSGTLKNGQIQFLGRTDDQLNINGVRIEPLEIERVLMSSGLVEEPVVVAQDIRPLEVLLRDSDPVNVAEAMKTAAGSENPSDALDSALRGKSDAPSQLTAHIVLARHANLRSVKEAAHASLPPLMRPTCFGVHKTLPRNSNGKLDRRSARLLHVTAPDSAQLSEPLDRPTDTLTIRVRQAFAQALHRTEFPQDSSFFDEGGDSLAALRLMIELENRENVQLPISALYDAPTPMQMANLLRPDKTEKHRIPIFAIPCDVGFTAPPSGFHANLSKSRQVIYLDHPCLRNRSQPIWSIGELAVIYSDEIEEKQPEGPILIAAFCIAAYVATEVASVLKSRGREIQHMLLFDPPIPGRQVERLRLRQGLPIHMAKIPAKAPIPWMINALENILVGRARAIRTPRRRSKVLHALIIASGHARRKRKTEEGKGLYMRAWPRGAFVATVFQEELTAYEEPVSILASEDFAKKYYNIYPEFLDAFFPQRTVLYPEKSHYALGVTRKAAKLAHDCFETAMLSHPIEEEIGSD